MATKTKAAKKTYPTNSRGVPMLPNLAALPKAFARCRKEQTAYVALAAVEKKPCAYCGIAIGDPYHVNKGDTKTHVDSFRMPAREGKWAKVRYFPKTKRVILAHYYCSWGHLMDQVVELGHRLQGR